MQPEPEDYSLAGLVEVKLDPGGTWLLDGQFEAGIYVSGGEVMRVSQQFPPGSPARPPSTRQLNAKPAECTAGLDTDPATWTWQNAASVLRRFLPTDGR